MTAARIRTQFPIAVSSHQPSAVSHKPSSRQPSTISHQPSANFGFQPSAVSHEPSDISQFRFPSAITPQPSPLSHHPSAITISHHHHHQPTPSYHPLVPLLCFTPFKTGRSSGDDLSPVPGGRFWHNLVLDLPSIDRGGYRSLESPAGRIGVIEPYHNTI